MCKGLCVRAAEVIVWIFTDESAVCIVDDELQGYTVTATESTDGSYYILHRSSGDGTIEMVVLERVDDKVVAVQRHASIPAQGGEMLLRIAPSRVIPHFVDFATHDHVTIAA